MNINELGKEQANPGKNMTGGQGEKAASSEGKAEGAKAGGAAPKKKLVAVYRPQNSQQIKSRPAGQKGKAASSQEGRQSQPGRQASGSQQEKGAGRNQSALKTLPPVERPERKVSEGKTPAEKAEEGKTSAKAAVTEPKAAEGQKDVQAGREAVREKDGWMTWNGRLMIRIIKISY